MGIYTNKAGLTLDEAKVGTKTAADWAAQGFSLVNSAPVAPVAPSGQVAIPGAQYNTKALQQANFTNIQPVGNTLYGTPITPESLKPTNPIVLPQQQPDSVDTAGAMVAGAGQTAKDITQRIKDTTPAPTDTENSVQALLNSIASTTEQQGQRGVDQLAAEAQNNVPQLNQQLADINSQILTETAAYDKMSSDVEGHGMNISNVLGQQGAIRKQAASSIGLLQARALGLQGMRDAAQKIADRAIDLKYQTEEAQINTYKAQLAALMPQLDKEEKIRAEAQLQRANEKEQAIADKKATDKEDWNLTLDGYTKLKPSDLSGVVAEAKAQGVDPESLIVRKPNGDIWKKPVVKPKASNGNTPKAENQSKSGWTQAKAETIYKQYIDGGYSAGEAANRVAELSGFKPKQGEFDISRQFIADNPNADPNELKSYLQQHTSLTDSEITAMLPKAKSNNSSDEIDFNKL